MMFSQAPEFDEIIPESEEYSVDPADRYDEYLQWKAAQGGGAQEPCIDVKKNAPSATSSVSQ